MDVCRENIYANSAEYATHYEIQIKTFLCSSFLPLASGIKVSDAFKSTYIGDIFPQFIMIKSVKNNLVFKCQICQHYLQFLARKGEKINGEEIYLEGFRQVYIHYISKHHTDAIIWWESNITPLLFNPVKKSNENQKITQFIKVSPNLAPVPCLFVWAHDLVDSFRCDQVIRRKQPKTYYK